MGGLGSVYTPQNKILGDNEESMTDISGLVDI